MFLLVHKLNLIYEEVHFIFFFSRSLYGDVSQTDPLSRNHTTMLWCMLSFYNVTAYEQIFKMLRLYMP